MMRVTCELEARSEKREAGCALKCMCGARVNCAQGNWRVGVVRDTQIPLLGIAMFSNFADVAVWLYAC